MWWTSMIFAPELKNRNLLPVWSQEQIFCQFKIRNRIFVINVTTEEIIPHLEDYWWVSITPVHRGGTL